MYLRYCYGGTGHLVCLSYYVRLLFHFYLGQLSQFRYLSSDLYEEDFARLVRFDMTSPCPDSVPQSSCLVLPIDVAGRFQKVVKS